MATQEYQRHGVSFRYPTGWELTEEGGELEWTITLQTAGASFWTMTLFADRPDLEQIVESVLAAYREDYDDLDVYPLPEGTTAAAGADLDFVYLDLVNSVVVRAFQTEERSVVVIYQGTDQELEVLREKFEAVTQSLEFGE